MIQGIDVSASQGRIDWTKVRDDEIRFAFIKATEGADYKSKAFDRNWAGAKAGRLWRGPYHYGRPDNREDPAPEVEWMYEVVGPLGDGDLPPVLDMEKWNSGLNPRDLTQWCINWGTLARAKWPNRRPVLYTYQSFWYYQLTGSTHPVSQRPTAAQLEQLWATFDLWQADIRSESPDDPDPFNPPWDPDQMDPYYWSWWQYSHTGRVDGISGGVDLDQTHLSEAELLMRYGEPGGVDELWTPSAPTEPIEPIPQSSVRSETVARLQGLLLAHGYGPTGLVGSNGRPDGKMGPKTQAALVDYCNTVSIPSDGQSVSWPVWWSLLFDGLDDTHDAHTMGDSCKGLLSHRNMKEGAS